MLKIPKLSMGKPFKIDMPFGHDSHSEPEMVSPFETMKQALKEALTEISESETGMTINPCGKLTLETVRKGDK